MSATLADNEFDGMGAASLPQLRKADQHPETGIGTDFLFRQQLGVVCERG
jgi:hypothetical protein